MAFKNQHFHREIMAFKNQDFHRSGPRARTRIDWKNADHGRSVVASLVKGAYVLERDRRGKREGSQALAPPWWETFAFQLKRILVDGADSPIFGAIFEYKPLPSSCNHSADGPCFVVAFRGTLFTKESFFRDIELDVQFLRNELHSSSRCKTAVQAVEDLVAAAGNSKVVWLAGHSLGSAIALEAGKNMAKKGYYLKSFLFNPPYASVPIEKIKSKIWKRAFQLAESGLCAAAALAKQSPEQLKQSADSFAALSPWVPQLFVNKADCVCSGYIGYFEHGKWMQKFRLGGIRKIASRYSVILLFMSENGTQAEPLHLIPSANLSINSKPPKCFLRAHKISEWWKLDLELESEVYKYEY
ncbi:GDSL esterase/lipase At4g10955 [Eucalyptus grandis]|uniref:GDSL esterase/lipase At4g10955 n=1 Tax=Eucalyptus grandis TaxID=71139 RepID=UPI00192EDC24|nr:GDSL esterase/lipase At4g10955 [Eucalyptus grandis]XP_039168462.1 GDSL esterase/lipase At4g10955 [Eucalyptus grandis]